MMIIQNNRIDFQVLKESLVKPQIWEKSTSKFWDDEYISRQMLGFHLDPHLESASKTKATISEETAFIIKQTGMDDKKTVVDLGCGPGLYVMEFAKTGADVTGIDLSKRSIDYANQHVKHLCRNAAFTQMNYLDLDFETAFDIATLIFYDFCVLNNQEQNMLLSRIHRALKNDGLFILDVITSSRKSSESTSISIYEGGGFWSPDPYIEIYSTFLYANPETEGMQYTIIAEDGSTRIIRLFHRLFNVEEIQRLLNDHHFRVEGIYKNLKGEPLGENSETLGIIARKV